MRPLRIISGGQTGVDRAALDVAIDLGIPYGGWCPKGRKAEDGRIPDRYALWEMHGTSYIARTRRNVDEAGVTLILSPGEIKLHPGTWATYQYASARRKPVAVVDLRGLPHLNAALVAGFIRGQVVNVAGPRESRCPGVHARARAFLLEVLR